MLTKRVNETQNQSFHYTDGGLLMRFGWQVCLLCGVNLQVHCVGGPSESFPSVEKTQIKNCKLATNPKTGQFVGQIQLHIPDL